MRPPAAGRACSAPGDRRRGDGRGSDGIRPARPWRRGFPDRHQVGARSARRRPTRNTSSAMPMRATARPSPTAWSWRAIPSCLIEGMAIAGFADGRREGLYLHAARNIRTPSPSSRRRSSLPRISWRRSCSKCARARAPMSAARRRRCSTASKASAAKSAPSRRSRRRRACSASRRSINNVARVWRPCPIMLAEGAKSYADFGMGRSRGTMPVQLAGNIKHWRALRDGVRHHAGRTGRRRSAAARRAAGRSRRVQVGGPLGAYLPPDQFDIPFDYEAFSAVDALIGHGGITVFDDTVDMARRWRASRWNSAQRRAAASARPAGSARRAAWS